LGWLGLSLIFLYLSLDEILELHETLILLFRTKFNLSGLLYFSWIVPYSIGVIIFSILYFPFMRNLRKKTALSFLIAGTIFIIGAVGIEMIDGNYFETYGADINYSLWTTLEEFLEMIGISYFIYALLKHLALNETDLLLSVDK
jgi:hypothetical protein